MRGIRDWHTYTHTHTHTYCVHRSSLIGCRSLPLLILFSRLPPPFPPFSLSPSSLSLLLSSYCLNSLSSLSLSLPPPSPPLEVTSSRFPPSSFFLSGPGPSLEQLCGSGLGLQVCDDDVSAPWHLVWGTVAGVMTGARLGVWRERERAREREGERESACVRARGPILHIIVRARGLRPWPLVNLLIFV